MTRILVNHDLISWVHQVKRQLKDYNHRRHHFCRLSGQCHPQPLVGYRCEHLRYYDNALRVLREAITPELVGKASCGSSAYRGRTCNKLIQAYTDSFLVPTHEGNVSIWHLSDVLAWL